MKVSIIGVGLIGGSIGLAIKRSGLKDVCITGVGRNIKNLKIAQKLKAVDSITTDLQKGVSSADVVFVCVPLSSMVGITQKVIMFSKPGAVITDVGSVKGFVVSEIEKFIKKSRMDASQIRYFVGGHPIAGSEKTSVRYSSSDLFKNAAVILTPAKLTDTKALNLIKMIWASLGAFIKIMSPERHDRVVAYTSHLPHVVAFALVKTVNHFEFSGSSFRDTTRIVSSDPEMWADIIFNNRKNVLPAVKDFRKMLSVIEKSGSRDELLKIFKKTKMKRDKLCCR
ncbi:MAG: prephenate dehydrogenase [Elusimicrobia bacterium ADurb.Bin231]|nr:MAG: prephenate dehydrogenase [Elusimicrobia bacterium ADurb.Bin231]